MRVSSLALGWILRNIYREKINSNELFANLCLLEITLNLVQHFNIVLI